MPNKLTDAEVKKTLEEYINFADLEYINHTSIEVDILKNALDLINCQQAEIENLKIENAVIRKQALAENKTTATAIMAETKQHIITAEKIKRLKEDNERLNALVKTKNKLIEGLDQSISYAYDRAIKEFAERLKNEIINDTAYACDSTQHSGYYDYQIKIGDIPEYIDNLVKEMVGDDNA